MQPTLLTYDQFTQVLADAKLPEELLKDLWSKAEWKKFPPNTSFNNEGDLHNKLFFMLTGCAVDAPPGVQSEPLPYRLIQAPFFITASMFSKMLGTNPYFARRTLTETSGMTWDLDYILDLADQYPNIYHFFCKAISSILLSLTDIEVTIAQCNSLERYQWFLLTYPNLINQIPLNYIAAYLNMRPETLSRVRAELANNS